MNLSKTVTLKEATYSTTAIRKGIDNTPKPEHIEAMKLVAQKVIDPLRERFPDLIINSFYRSPALNKAVGSKAKVSQHMLGQAVDIDSRGNLLNIAIFNFVKENMVFDQLLYEHPDENGVPSWIHVSIRERDNRGDIAVILAGDKKIPYGEFQIGMV